MSAKLKEPGHIVDVAIAKHTGDVEAQVNEVRAQLVKQNRAPCVVIDWANECRRRDSMRKRIAAKKERKVKLPDKGFPFRRIIFERNEPIPESDYQYTTQLHATKGWRSFKEEAINTDY